MSSVPNTNMQSAIQPSTAIPMNTPVSQHMIYYHYIRNLQWKPTRAALQSFKLKTGILLGLLTILLCGIYLSNGVVGGLLIGFFLLLVVLLGFAMDGYYVLLPIADLQ